MSKHATKSKLLAVLLTLTVVVGLSTPTTVMAAKKENIAWLLKKVTQSYMPEDLMVELNSLTDISTKGTFCS